MVIIYGYISVSRGMYFHKADPCILGGGPFRVEWTSVGAAIALQDSLQYILL